ncbi:MAG: DNA methyltransferase, partial [Thermomicrobiales bacterium]
MPPTNRPASSPVASVRHTDTRVNIPTEELRDFVPEDGQTPPLRYPRDPSLDPQLVWRGKDEQNATDLAVPVVPIYIQEKIHPQALVEDVRAHAQPAGGAAQLDLFGDFNGVDDFADLVDFYHHEQHWTNRLILGDSLLAMTSLAEKEGLRGKVQCIYVDPPYGIKFNSNWQVSTRKRDVKDGKAEDLTRQPEQIKAYRDTWELGIHSYLTYLRDRLTVARDLLTESGSIFVQIGDENVHLVRCLMDEVFGRENSCGLITFKKTGASTDDLLPSGDDYILWFAKNREVVKYRQLYKSRILGEPGTEEYIFVETPNGTTRSATSEELAGIHPLEPGYQAFRPTTLTSSHHYSLGTGTYRFQGRDFSPGTR